MTSSAATRPDLVSHLVIAAASSMPYNGRISVKFRTFDPSDTQTPYKPLKNARVDLVRSDGGNALHGVTDNSGILRDAANPNASLVVDAPPQDVLFHFEVLGPASDSNLDLRSMTYPDGGTCTPFPVPMWSTKGWQEPEKHFGEFKLSGGGASGLKPFTVGCCVNVPLRFVRGTSLSATFPENIALALVSTTPLPAAVTTVTPLTVKPGGRLSAAILTVNPGDRVEVAGYLNAGAIVVDHITPVATILKTEGETRASIGGELFGLGALPNASSIELYISQAAIPYPDTFCLPDSPRLEYAAYRANRTDAYLNLSTQQKLCVCFNWFL
jgi:hypothetical protein